MMHRNLDLGMEKMCKNGEKSIWKEREKVFVLTNCFTLLSLFSSFYTRLFVYHDLVMTLSS